ncbi:flagellar basal body-associated FliL family protein [Asticcacaulis sp. SL142]|uniref:flagellar basal body-associated FliL family protein n=1 Tax=Asticcacaulis sp. SL142 TaxID=2995155 RepID=UPI00226CCC75|nr:flagellar basal body-associated FliL family protein [Asticcacaulis sp. SL142]WAC48052.1 flagellar basal body-associated FliL family protein [Asticcacaulis sp. SL142]
MAKGKDKKPKDAEAPPVDGEAAADGEGAPKKKGPPILIIAISAGVLLLGGGGAAAYFLLLAPKPAAEAGEHGKAEEGHGKEDKKDAKKDDGHGKKKEEKGGHGGGAEAEVDPSKQPVITEGPNGVTYYTLPPLISNIQSAGGRASYLKLKLTFEVADHETVEALGPNMPRIQDVLQSFLRELRPEDMAGSQGNYQLRLEILRRVNLVMAPHKVNAVLIEEMLIT